MSSIVVEAHGCLGGGNGAVSTQLSFPAGGETSILRQQSKGRLPQTLNAALRFQPIAPMHRATNRVDTVAKR